LLTILMASYGKTAFSRESTNQSVE
jgi:hypothetical protein